MNKYKQYLAYSIIILLVVFLAVLYNANAVSKLFVYQGGTGTTTASTGGVWFADSSSFRQDPQNLFWDFINHRLGVATGSPAYPLDVYGNARIDGSLKLSSSLTIPNNSGLRTTTADGLTTFTIFNMGSDDKTYFNSDSVNFFDLTVGESYFIIDYLGEGLGADFNFGDDAMVLSSGKLGIGTTTPTELLHSVEGIRSGNFVIGGNPRGFNNTFTSGGYTPDGFIYLDNTYKTFRIGINPGSSYENIAFMMDGQDMIGINQELFAPAETYYNNVIALGTTTSKWKSLTVGTGESSFDGNVGIGTTSPDYPLHIASGGFLSGTDDTTFGAFKHRFTGAGTDWFGIYDTGNALYYGISTSLPSPGGTAMVGGYYQGLGIGGANNNDQPIFGVLASDQSLNGIGNVAFTIHGDNKIQTYNSILDDGSGKMGIGTSSPNAMLDVWSTTEQFRLNYNQVDYSSFVVNDDGDLTIALSQASTATTTIQSKAFVIDVGSYHFEFSGNNGTGTIRYISE